MPSVKLTWGNVATGAAAAAVAFIGAETLAVLCLRTSALRPVYGAAGSFIVVLFWFYISS